MNCKHIESHIPAVPGWFFCWRSISDDGKMTRIAIEPIVAWHLHTRITLEENGDATHQTITHPVSAFLTTDNCDFEYLLMHEDRWGEGLSRTLAEPDGSEVLIDRDRDWRHSASDWFREQDADRAALAARRPC
jgi:hypothetical protein